MILDSKIDNQFTPLFFERPCGLLFLREWALYQMQCLANRGSSQAIDMQDNKGDYPIHKLAYSLDSKDRFQGRLFGGKSVLASPPQLGSPEQQPWTDTVAYSH
jgi:hypothetical protein